MAEMKGIKLCGECGNYDWKKHKCKIGCNDDSNAQATFYGDCPLPDVVPKSEVERLRDDNKFLQDRRFKELSEVRQEVAREIFDDIERLMFATKIGTLHGFYYSTDLKTCIDELKEKYTESEGKK